MARKKQTKQYRPVIDKDRNDKAHALARRWQVESESAAVRRAIDLAYAEEDLRSQLQEAQARVVELGADNQRLEETNAAALAAEQELNQRLEELEEEANQSGGRAEALSNDIEAAVGALEHAGLIEPSDERPLQDGVEQAVRRYANMCELKEATEVTAKAAQANYEQALADRDAARSDLADMERQRNEARGERTAALLERDRVRRERDKALSELADRAGWWTGWTVGIVCGTAGTLAATWLASGGLG